MPAPLSHLTLPQLAEGLADLLDRRLPALAGWSTSALLLPILAAQRRQLEGLPLHGDQLPLTREIEAADDSLDDQARAILSLLDAVDQHPGAGAALRDAAARLREDLLPSTAELIAPRLDQVQALRARRPLLDTLDDDINRFTTPDGAPLSDWLAGLFDSADRLHDLLRQRAEQLAARTPDVDPRALRSDVLRSLRRLRDLLNTEASLRPDAGPSDVAEVFAFLDQLART